MDPRTRALLEAPIASAPLRLAMPNMLIMLAQAAGRRLVRRAVVAVVHGGRAANEIPDISGKYLEDFAVGQNYGSGRITAIWPIVPAFTGWPSPSITATLWPGTGLPIAPGLRVPSASHEASTRLHSVWP